MQQFWDSIVEAIGLLRSLNGYVLQVVGLSFEVSGSAVLIGLLIGIPLGLLLGLGSFRGRSLLVALVNTGLGLATQMERVISFACASQTSIASVGA